MTGSPDRPDLGPAAAQVARLVHGTSEAQLAAPTPCVGTPVAGLLDHLVGLTLAFTLGARKQAVPGGPSASAEDLVPGWRDELPRQLDELAAAWRRDEAWRGETTVGGVTMPGEVMGVVALDELVLHGWDLARATGQAFALDPLDAAALLPFLESSASPEGTPGLFGPAVDVPRSAPALDRLLGLSGRDPSWTP